uniref:Uncharacterized protein n=1 Tax=Anopheles farauti TaxID=69004 RepID=A0A182Q8C3_9DIPT
MESAPGGDGQFSTLDELQRKLNEDFAQTLGPMASSQHTLAGSSGASGTGATIATTISTIVLQGGPLQLVVAILKLDTGLDDGPGVSKADIRCMKMADCMADDMVTVAPPVQS